MSAVVGVADRPVRAPRVLAPVADGGGFRAIHAFLRRRWLAVAGTASAVLLSAIVAVQLIPPRYAARADVLLDPRRDKAFGPDDAGAVSLDTASVAALCRNRTKM